MCLGNVANLKESTEHTNASFQSLLQHFPFGKFLHMKQPDISPTPQPSHTLNATTLAHTNYTIRKTIWKLALTQNRRVIALTIMEIKAKLQKEKVVWKVLHMQGSHKMLE